MDFISNEMIEAACKAYRLSSGDMRAALEAAMMVAWRTIEEAKQNEEYLLFEPTVRAGQGILSARMVVQRWPTSYPRQASHFMPLPPEPSK